MTLVSHSPLALILYFRFSRLHSQQLIGFRPELSSNQSDSTGIHHMECISDLLLLPEAMEVKLLGQFL